MSGNTSYKRYPAVHCWLKHVEDSSYNEEKNIFYTIFGIVKRIRIIATIIDKKEKLIEFGDEDIGLVEDDNSNVRLILNLDDGTGIIRGILENIDPENFRHVHRGQIVDVVGRISKKGGPLTLWIEIINEVEDPNYILLRNAEILNRIKSGDIQDISVISSLNNEMEESSNEIDVNNLFEDNSIDIERSEVKERLYSIIEQHTTEGNGISFEKLKEEMKLPEIELRTYINDLILESRIYKSDSGIYESF
ncbi:MAG: hypothetical protein ACFFEN_06825 [Candidatus Thorarchaeota archaeon]